RRGALVIAGGARGLDVLERRSARGLDLGARDALADESSRARVYHGRTLVQLPLDRDRGTPARSRSLRRADPLLGDDQVGEDDDRRDEDAYQREHERVALARRGDRGRARQVAHRDIRRDLRARRRLATEARLA